jgi:hypothetical protein
MIKRKTVALSRLLTMPCSYGTVMVSKIFVYLGVCMLQYILILLMGMYLFPCSVCLSGSKWPPGETLSVMAVAAAWQPISYGISIGTIAPINRLPCCIYLGGNTGCNRGYLGAGVHDAATVQEPQRSLTPELGFERVL